MSSSHRMFAGLLSRNSGRFVDHHVPGAYVIGLWFN
jgi:hypothetical protein